MNKSAILILVAMLMTSSVPALLTQSASLEVTVTNIKEVKGSVRINLFTDETTFLKKPYQGKVVKVNGKTITFLFENLPFGDYALSAIHDENENGELDSNSMGIPKEGFAFGNDASGTFGPPDFEKTLVTLSGEGITKHHISLKYF